MAPSKADEPLYQRLEDKLRASIASGLIAAGARLPTEVDMCAQHSVSRATLRRALDALERDGLVSRSRRRGTFVLGGAGALQRQVIGVIAPELGGGMVRTIVDAAERVMVPSGLDARYYLSHGGPEGTERTISRAEEDGVAGLVVFPADDTWYSEELARLVRRGFPVCLFDRALRHLFTDCVTTDNGEAGRLAAQHLLGLGHRSIAFVTEPGVATESVYSRLEGFRGGLVRAGLPDGPAFRACGTDGLGKWREELAAVLALEGRPSAIVAVNDSIGMQAIDIAMSMGLRVPDELAVVAFGNPDMGHKFVVPLTTIEQPLTMIGTVAALTLMERMVQPDAPLSHKVLQPTLVVRDSCGASRPRRTIE